MLFRKLKKTIDTFEVSSPDMFLGNFQNGANCVFEDLDQRDKEAITSLGTNIDTGSEKAKTHAS